MELINYLDTFVNREVGKRMIATGIKIRKQDIVREIAAYTGVTWGQIDRIKRGLANPSLPVALKIAEYFNVTVEDIFKING